MGDDGPGFGFNDESPLRNDLSGFAPEYNQQHQRLLGGDDSFLRGGVA